MRIICPGYGGKKRKGVNNELEIDENGLMEMDILMLHIADVDKEGKYGLVTLSHAPYNKSAIMPVQEADKLQRKNNILYCIYIYSSSNLN
ncbi:MAG TPA: hypothetical protein VIP56_07025 [Nitrososphaeraceae archaeon]